MIASFLSSGASAVAVVNGALTRPLDRCRGLPQGAPLSPLIFNIYIASLVAELNRQASPTNPASLFFADDGTISATDERESQELLNIAESWAERHGMEYNVNKCAVVSDLPIGLRLCEQEVPQVESVDVCASLRAPPSSEAEVFHVPILYTTIGTQAINRTSRLRLSSIGQ